MRWSLITVRLVILVVSLITAAILVLTIFPLATGGLKIDVPQDNVTWNMDGDVVNAEVPVNIYNGGYFDIEDFALSVNMTDVDGTPLSTSTSVPIDLRSGSWTEVVLPVQIDLSTLPLEKRMDIIFNGTEVKIGIGMDSYFGLRTIHVTMDGKPDQTMEVPAMITNLNIDPSDLRLVNTRGGYQLVQPFSFSASDLLVGRNVDVSAVISDGSGTLGSTEMSLSLQQNTHGEMSVPLSQSTVAKLLGQNDSLLVTASVSFENISYSRTVRYDWTPPITNFAVESVSLSAGQVLFNYRFDATSMVTGQSAVVVVTVTDQTGPVGNATDSFTITSVNHRSMPMYISPAVLARIAGNAEDWQVDFAMTINGATTHVTKTYHWNGGV